MPYLVADIGGGSTELAAGTADVDSSMQRRRRLRPI